MQCFKILILFVSLLLAQQSFAKDMTHRLGVGFKNNTSVSVPSLAAIYYADKDTAYTASFGIDTLKGYTAMQGSVGLRYVIFYENNLNCYVGGQAGVLNVETPVTGKQSGAEFMALGGVEFFFSGLENLGFSAEAGVGLATIGSTRIYTTALDPVKAGITFYF